MSPQIRLLASRIAVWLRIRKRLAEKRLRTITIRVASLDLLAKSPKMAAHEHSDDDGFDDFLSEGEEEWTMQAQEMAALERSMKTVRSSGVYRVCSCS